MKSILRGWSNSVMVNLVTTYKEVMKATRQNIMVIGIHKCSNRKSINATNVKDF